MKRNFRFWFGAGLLALFVIYTVSLTVVDLQPIGPQGSWVAYAGLNKAVHELFGVHMILYHITDWAGVVAIFVAVAFAVLGLIQWIQRKHILKVDSNLLALGVFYIVVFGVFVFFEYHVINRRPVLINGYLEASYPSSTTLLAMCVLPTAMMQFRQYIRKMWLRKTVNILCGVFTAFMVLGRLVCGVHWFTDILGGMFFSAGMIFLYAGALNMLKQNE